jgi:cytochrome P450
MLLCLPTMIPDDPHSSIHYREDYWPGAREFQPERFLGKSEAQTAEIDSAQWLPFALGARQCPAR